MDFSSITSRFQSFLSGLLIVTLLVSQTFQVSWFDQVQADQSDYYDVVSIFVDRNTYDILKPEISQYASDIQAYLPQTRTNIQIIDTDTTPVNIATINEKLYYEGDSGEGVSRLVGTILIGDVPLPIVSRGGKTFPSIFPYVDFADKAFIYTPEKNQYLAQSSSAWDTEADIWHGVIDPDLSAPMTDEAHEELRHFFEKTHAFYTQSGNFTQFSTQEPRVFYHDADREFSGLSLGNLYAYTLRMRYIEDIVYNRYSKYFAQYLMEMTGQYDATLEDEDVDAYLASLGMTGATESSLSSLENLPDVQTQTIIDATAKQFYEIVNSTTLGDIQSAVRNAGRYTSGATVRVDTAPIGVTGIDTTSALLLRGLNEQLEAKIDQEVQGYARRIALLDSVTITNTGSYNADTGNSTPSYEMEYKNYFFGQKAEEIMDPSLCSIARGSDHTSDFRDGILVEANIGFDVRKIMSGAEILASDTEALVGAYGNNYYSCFPSGASIRTASYWGKNSGLNLATGATSFLESTSLKGFSLPIYSLGGMNETSRLTPISPIDCTSSTYQYTLLQPYTRPASTQGGETIPGGTWPELGRFTCITTHVVGTGRTLSTEFPRYQRTPCLVGTITLDGATIASSSLSCITSSVSPSDTTIVNIVDNTDYEDQIYHTIPSIIYHKSPTDEEWRIANNNGATPSLAIDHDRYVEFLTPKGQLAKIQYPNFFRMEADTVEDFRAELRDFEASQWDSILTSEAQAIDPEANISQYLVTGSLPTSSPDWNQYLTDDIIRDIIRIRKWLQADPYNKYNATIESFLSVSHDPDASDTTRLAPGIIPDADTRSVYDMAYLSLGNFSPAEAPSDLADLIASIQAGLANISSANLGESGSESIYSKSDACGPIDGVELMRWFPAVLCWIKNMLPPRISAGSCGGSTFGSESQSLLSAQDSEGRYEFLTGGDILLSLSGTTLAPGETTNLQIQYEKNGNILDLLSSETISLEILEIRDVSTNELLYDGISTGGEALSEYIDVYTGAISLDHGIALVPLTAGNHEVHVTLQAHMGPFFPGESDQELEVTSEPLTVTIAEDAIAILMNQGGKGTSQITAGAGNVQLGFSSLTEDALYPPFHVRVTDTFQNQVVFSQDVESTIMTLPDSIAQKASQYTLEVEDSLGHRGTATFSVFSGLPHDISISTPSDILIYGATLPVVVSLLDEQKNAIQTQLSTIHLEVSNGYILLPDGTRVTEADTTTFDGYGVWEIGSDGEGVMTLIATTDATSLQATKDVSLLYGAKIILQQYDFITAGSDAVPMQIRVEDALGNPLTSLSTFASITLPKEVGAFSSGTIALSGGVSSVFSFLPGKQAGTFDAVLDIPGITDENTARIQILPGASMYVKLEDNSASGTLVATLYDRYGNITTDSFAGTYQYLSGPETSFSFTRGTAILPRQSGYVTIHVPALENASLQISDDAGSVVIPGVADAVLFIQPDAQILRPYSDYNALYTILPGGTYTDLGSDVLYRTDPSTSVSLAVTTLLSDPTSYGGAFSLSSSGVLSLGSSLGTWYKTIVMQSEGNLMIRVMDEYSHEVVGDILPDISAMGGVACTSPRKCTGIPSDGGYVSITPRDTDFTAISSEDSTSLVYSGSITPIFTFRVGTDFFLANGYELEVDPSPSSASGLTLLITHDTYTIAEVQIVADSIDTFQILPGPNYKTHTLDGAMSASLGVEVIQKIPDSDDTLDTDRVGPSEKTGFEEIRRESAIGWQGDNISMLSFAGGDTVGEATKWQSTYLMINLGDPVAHVRSDAPGVEKNGLDRTIGTMITGGSKGNIDSYTVVDTNNDGYDDILILYDTKYVELLLNEKGRFRSRGYVAHLSDAGGDFEAGDFTGDGYGDFLIVSDLGALELIDNTDGRLSRMAITLDSGSLPEAVVQMKIFDMDADGKDDIVYLSDAGELAILYGTSTPGVFTKKIVESGLTLSLDTSAQKAGGAIYFQGLRQLPEGYIDISELSGDSEMNESMIRRTVYYQRMISENDPEDTAGQSRVIQNVVGTDEYGNTNLALSDQVLAGLADVSEIVTGSTLSTHTPRTYIRSEYAEAENISVERTFSSSGSRLQTGTPVTVTITIINNSANTLENGEYLDSVGSIFSLADTKTYSQTTSDTPIELPITFLQDEFDILMQYPSIAPGGKVTLSYTVTTLPITYGDLIVGLLETGEVGDDNYGDIAFDTKSTCGASVVLWRSTASRMYERGVRDFSQAEIPAELQQYFTDLDNNGIPDYIDTMSIEEREEQLASYTDTEDLDTFVDPVTYNNGNLTLTLGLTSELESQIRKTLNEIQTGLSCGFGGGSCLSFPVNWAPLAPGSTPSIFGIPLGMLTPSTGMPTFSSITGIPLYGPWGCVPVPTVYPVSAIGYSNTCGANLLSAGGYLGTWDPTNSFRFYITPTLTLGMGEALCIGGPSQVVGNSPPQGVSPLVPGGNCIVIAHSMPICAEDGSESDGDVSGISGLGTLTDSWNSASCTLEANTTTDTDPEPLRQEIMDYIKNPSASRLLSVSTSMTQYGGNISSLSTGPLVTIGSGDGAIGVDVTIDSRKGFSFEDIVNITNKSVSAFPDFLMDWVDRQVEEIVNKFLTLPSLMIILPQPTQNWSIADYSKGWDTLAESWNSTDQKSAFSGSSDGRFHLRDVESLYDTTTNSISTSLAGGTNAIRSAYEFIGKLPLVEVHVVQVPIQVPWITGEDLDKTYMKWKLSLAQYEAEIQDALDNWCTTDATSECLDTKLRLNASPFLADLRYNIQMLETYKKFPEKLMKLLTWKEKLLDQITCNIDAIEQMVEGWLRDNSVRFRAWVESIVLIKAILKSWQPILDLFADYQQNCTVCRNERYDLKYFQFKIISALIPTLPVIRFPKWPDIVLDLHDIRAGLRISLPEFTIDPVPIRLPDLPSLSLPDSPTASFTLPGIPRLPALPDIPDLPELPSLPTITLPNLPPPPKLPKILGSITGVIKILNIVEKVLCLMRKELWVPEWRVGDVIAQRTSRQGTLPIDFLNIQFPQFSSSFLSEIVVETHVNLEFRTDFLIEMAEQIVAPINEAPADLRNLLPSQVAPDVNISSPLPSQNLQLYNDTSSPFGLDATGSLSFIALIQSAIDTLEADRGVYITSDAMKDIIRHDLETSTGVYTEATRAELMLALSDSDFGTDAVTAEISEANRAKFRAIRDVIDAQKNETEKLRAILELQGKPEGIRLVEASRRYHIDSVSSTGFTLIPQAQAESISSTSSPSHSALLAEKLNARNNQDISALQTMVSSFSEGSERRRLAYANETLSETISTLQNSNSSVTATPNYEGIYVLDDTGKQIRLFDWTEELQGDEMMLLSDVDRDGDRDFIFRVGNTLFVKERLTVTPTAVYTQESFTSDISSTLPTAVNNLRETVTSPNSINLSWSPAHSDDRIFRIGFYRSMFRNDDEKREHQDFDDKYIVDALVTETDGEALEGVPLRASPTPLFVRSVRGDSTVTSPGVRVLPVESVFAVSSRRYLYAGDAGATIGWSATSSGENTTITLAPYTQYEMTSAGNIRVFGGKIYIEDQNAPEISASDLVGMPLLPDVTLTPSAGGASVEVGSSFSDVSLIVRFSQTYRVIDIGDFASRYSAHFDMENGWYYGGMEPVIRGLSVEAGVVLMSPEREADREGPVIDISDTLRIPVYIPTFFPLGDLVSDRDTFTLVWDVDGAVDTDGDGDPENDFVSGASGIVEDTGSGIVFGPFSDIRTRKIILKALDGNGNESQKSFTLSVYAPIPQIDTMSSGSVSGFLENRIDGEPIDIMRYRGGSLVRITDDSTLTESGGVFTIPFVYQDIITENILTGPSGPIATIVPTTGVITLSDEAYHVTVIPATLESPLSLTLSDTGGAVVYSESLALGYATSIGTSGSGVIITPYGDFTFVPNSLLATTLPGGGFIVDTDAHALVGVGRDGNLYQIDDTVSFEYLDQGGYVTIVILKDDDMIATVEYKIQGVFSQN